MPAVHVFTEEERNNAKIWLATRVAAMMGRKLEEEDWSHVYCKAKNIPADKWSNLHIDINYEGLGIELKMLKTGIKPIKSVCGTSLMHPAATRSIRVDNSNAPANDVMVDIFNQYKELIISRTGKVKEKSPYKSPDMRTGWFIWEHELTEFLYFEEPMIAPEPDGFYAVWNETPAKGVRKSSRSLWIYEKETNKKKYSVTTSAGAKIQPYFDVPPPSDPNLYYFRVQGEPVGENSVNLWVSASTAHALNNKIGSLESSAIEDAILKISHLDEVRDLVNIHEECAVPIKISKESYERLKNIWEAVSDEHRAQLLLKSLQ